MLSCFTVLVAEAVIKLFNVEFGISGSRSIFSVSFTIANPRINCAATTPIACESKYRASGSLSVLQQEPTCQCAISVSKICCREETFTNLDPSFRRHKQICRRNCAMTHVLLLEKHETGECLQAESIPVNI